MTTATLDTKNFSSFVIGKNTYIKTDWQVFECYKCSGTKRFNYQNGTVGKCYPCQGTGLTMSKNVAQDLPRDTRYVTHAIYNKADETFMFWYISRWTDGTPGASKKFFKLNESSESQKEFLRKVWSLSSSKIVQE